MIESILPCPFCGGEAELSRCLQTAPNEYCSDSTFISVECKSCKASSSRVLEKPFCEMSEYTVQDFRENKDLRPTVEVIHNNHKEDVRLQAVSAWNDRSLNLEAIIKKASNLEGKGSAYIDLCSAHYKINEAAK